MKFRGELKLEPDEKVKKVRFVYLIQGALHAAMEEAVLPRVPASAQPSASVSGKMSGKVAGIILGAVRRRYHPSPQTARRRVGLIHRKQGGT